MHEQLISSRESVYSAKFGGGRIATGGNSDSYNDQKGGVLYNQN